MTVASLEQARLRRAGCLCEVPAHAVMGAQFHYAQGGNPALAERLQTYLDAWNVQDYHLMLPPDLAAVCVPFEEVGDGPEHSRPP